MGTGQADLILARRISGRVDAWRQDWRPPVFWITGVLLAGCAEIVGRVNLAALKAAYPRSYRSLGRAGP
jgi:hypothetical protein